MRASSIEFRLRTVIVTAVVTLGFWSPWIRAWGIGRRTTSLEWLALQLSHIGLVSFSVAIPMMIVTGAAIAAAGAALRIWGTAYLGSGTVNHVQMRAGILMADGPYRYVRNPLYLGSCLMVTALAFVMPPTGAAMAIVVVSIFFFRLILAEEVFLSNSLGDSYRIYLQSVPRLIPRWRRNLPSSTRRAHWIAALLAELNPVNVFVTLAFISWSYDHWLMIRAIIIGFGISLVVKALVPLVLREPDAVA